MTFIDIGEIGCMSIPKCHWMVIVVTRVKQTWFLQDAAYLVWCCVPDRYRVSPPLAAVIAARRRGMFATRRWGRCTRISAHLSSRCLAELTKILERVVHTGDGTAQFIPNMFYWVAVWRSCRLLHLGDVALLKEIMDYPSTVRCGVIVLVAVVIPKMLPGQWH